MNKINYVEGDLINLVKEGVFDIIGHGCNCFCKMTSGIAPQMAKAFKCDKFPMELIGEGNINKLGQIDYQTQNIFPIWKEIHFGNKVVSSPDFGGKDVVIINCYTQYYYEQNSPNQAQALDYDALRICMRKINHEFSGKSIGLPMIGACRGGGDWNIISKIIEEELIDMEITVVKHNKEL